MIYELHSFLMCKNMWDLVIYLKLVSLLIWHILHQHALWWLCFFARASLAKHAFMPLVKFLWRVYNLVYFVYFPLNNTTCWMDSFWTHIQNLCVFCVCVQSKHLLCPACYDWVANPLLFKCSTFPVITYCLSYLR